MPQPGTPPWKARTTRFLLRKSLGSWPEAENLQLRLRRQCGNQTACRPGGQPWGPARGGTGASVRIWADRTRGPPALFPRWGSQVNLWASRQNSPDRLLHTEFPVNSFRIDNRSPLAGGEGKSTGDCERGRAAWGAAATQSSEGNS